MLYIPSHTINGDIITITMRAIPFPAGRTLSKVLKASHSDATRPLLLLTNTTDVYICTPLSIKKLQDTLVFQGKISVAGDYSLIYNNTVYDLGDPDVL